MKKIIKLISLICAALLCVGSLAACGGAGKPRSAYKKVPAVKLDNQVVAENDRFILRWDGDWMALIMESKATGQIWSTIPYDYYQQLISTDPAAVDPDSDLVSPITIDVVEPVGFALDWAKAFPTCIPCANESYSEEYKGSATAKKIENGVEVNFYFDDYEISVPVQYVLRSDSLAISVDSTKITEGSKYQLLDVCLSPFLSSAVNEAADSYLFVPSGNGALMNTDIRVDGRREYTGEIYGTDASRVLENRYFEEEQVKMPVFGVKSGATQATLAIVEEGASSVEIVGIAGDDTTDYSRVYGKCYVRGYDIIADDYGWKSTVYTRTADYMTDQNIKIAYYPLEGDDANYTGMANCYRDYMIKNGMKKTELAEQTAYAVSLLGNVQTKKLAYGVPYYSTDSMTTFAQAKSILTELKTETGIYPATQLVGYGKTGIDVGAVGGGFGFASCSGSKKDYQSIISLGQKNKFLVATDFEMLLFDEGGSGLSTMTDVAKSASLSKSKLYYPGVALREYNEDAGEFYLVAREKLGGLMDKLKKKADKLGVSGISVASLGHTAYADYAQEKYFDKKNMPEDVSGYLRTLASRKKAVTTDNANDYAVAVSDTLFNVDVTPQYMNSLDSYIPFYQMVFKGYVPMYSTALNLESNYDFAKAQALSCGTGLGFTLIWNYDSEFIATPHENLFNTLYRDHKEQIAKSVQEYGDFYAVIGNSAITDYSFDDGVAKTTYENGVVSYTNLTDSEKNSPVGPLAAYTLVFQKGGE